MNNRELVRELEFINLYSESKLLNQIIAMLVIGFYVGIPDDVYNDIFNLNLKTKSNQKEIKPNVAEVNKYRRSIIKIETLFHKITNDEMKLIIGTLITSIGFKKLEELKNILGRINQHVEMYNFKNDISIKDRTLH